MSKHVLKLVSIFSLLLCCIFYYYYAHVAPSCFLSSFFPSIPLHFRLFFFFTSSFLHFIHSSFSPYLFLLLPPPFLLSSLSSFIFSSLPSFLPSSFPFDQVPFNILNKSIYLFSYHRLLTSSTLCNNI